MEVIYDHTQPRMMLNHSRTKFRKEANAADNKGATLAVDSLINYEAVKVRYSVVSSALKLILMPRHSTMKNTKQDYTMQL